MIMSIELKRNPETGLVEAYENKEKIGEVITMGDRIEKEETHEDSI